ncbi:MAG: MFS transporter [Actinobacteria bacterium]|nr:MFS transporter [Actinomycetota bacterium]
MALHPPEPAPEDATDALVDGDRVFARGTAQAALSHRTFRIVWGGTFASNIGSWMQNVLLGAYALRLTHSATYVGLLFFAQLGPLLFLSNVGGVLADLFDRRVLLLWAQAQQLVFSVVLAVVATSDHPSRVVLFVCVLLIGIGNALGAPALSAILPTLVPKADLPGAVSLQSVQMNLSRVIGPAIGAALYTTVGVAPVFGLNAATYLFAIVALVSVDYPRRPPTRTDVSLRARLGEGFAIVRRDPLVRRLMITLFSMSFFSLAFVGLMPVIAKVNLGIPPKSIDYGVLYGAFGLGAAFGAVSVGTWFAQISKARLVRPGMLAFAGLLAAFALVRTPWAGFVLAPILGYAYFLVITSMSTVLQSHIDDAVRGRVIALWIMGFGGTVPLGVLAGGLLEEVTSITFVLLVGAVAAVVLAAYADLESVAAD